eukprot:TRINITY_DN27785_c0_g1_i1.p1 TRINITY_DN27785_c0_g1~~TRINITY_DN27785_c0_g1_i1.p1  ORF type:complete len:612 (-),score=69.08 TRINITY_DN27785_c0_g1_i1:13-1848(-)
MGASRQTGEMHHYNFHRCNIHERRRAALCARCFPLLCFLSVIVIAAFGFVMCPSILLALCAFLNLTLCLGMSSSGLFCLLGIRFIAKELKHEGASVEEDSVLHLIVIPNYKEDLNMLQQTLRSLSEAHGSQHFHVVLAMEAREGEAAEQKAHELIEQFSKHFGKLSVTSHPSTLSQEHIDGSSDKEVPGKASNLKWAVHEAYTTLQQDGGDVTSVVLTVADADVLFHPRYFVQITKDFCELRTKGCHLWTLWQAPQLPFRNYYVAPACSRVWAYVASVYEFGGVAGLSFGGEHIVFSAYSLPLQLAVMAQAHEGDVIAEDHHCYIRCFFYSALALAHQSSSSHLEEIMPGQSSLSGIRPLQLRPVYLPAKATSVLSDQGAWQTWIDRWHQAKRHAQGVAELSYVVLATYDAFSQLRGQLLRFWFVSSVVRMIGRMMYIHLLPACQFVAMVTLTLCWVSGGGSIPTCTYSDSSVTTTVCALAGVWLPTWPIIAPSVFIIVGTIALVVVAYIRPAAAGHYRGSLWASEAGGLPLTWGSSKLTLVGLVIWDCAIYAGILVLPYGIMVEVLAFWSVAFRGNRFDYITATKAMRSEATQKDHSPLLTQAMNAEDAE